MNGIGVVVGHVEHHIETHLQQIGAHGAGTAGGIALPPMLGIGAHIAHRSYPHGLGYDVCARRRDQPPLVLYSAKDAPRQLIRAEGVALCACIQSAQFAGITWPQTIHAVGRYRSKIGGAESHTQHMLNLTRHIGGLQDG